MIQTFLHTFLSPILVISVLVFIHELGHFLVAKWCDVGVVKFSVGFGPALFRFRRKETVYQFSLIPLGGFVRMVGDMPDMLTGTQPTDEAVRNKDEAESEVSEDDHLSKMLGVEVSSELQGKIDDPNSWFLNKNYWQKSAIVFAGPLFNFILAFVLIFISAFFLGQYEAEEQAIIGEVIEGSPAESSGLASDDKVVSINGKSVATWQEMAETIHASGGGALAVEFERDELVQTITVTPQEKEYRYPDGTTKKAHVIGISGKLNLVEAGFFESLETAKNWTYNTTMLTYVGLGQMVTGQASPKDLAGPIFILQEAGKQSEKGIDRLISLTAILSISLAVLNLLPIPVLDGGHLLFFLIEAIFGPINIRIKEVAQSVGMLLLLGLMAFSIRNDIVREPRGFDKGLDFTESDKEEGNSQITDSKTDNENSPSN